MQAVVEYGILGPLQVARTGSEIEVTAPKLRTTLLALLLRPSQVVSVDQLVDALWPASAPTSAVKLVQVYVSQLRALLGSEALETVAPGYRLPVEAGALDAARFERLHAEARDALADGNPSLALARCHRALGLWRGPALADVAYAPFAATEAARLDELRLACVEDRLDAELALGRHDDVVGELERLCADHPLRERPRQRLALALYRAGRQADAVRTLADGRRILRDELGLDPGAEHERLERAILQHSPELHPGSGPAVRLTPRPVPVSPMVGRRADLERIAALLERDDVRLVTITGPGGSGKTRVALELARSLGQRFANGCVFVELAPLRDPARVLAAIARQVGGLEHENLTAELLADRVRNLELLVVVDNFEHLVDAAADLAALLRGTERLTVLATSRRVLHVGGEHVYPLEPLPERDAVTLFGERMVAAGRDPAKGDPDDVIGAICRRVDCLPLGVELAAARTATMAPGLLLTRLSDRVAALGVGPRDAPARQRTIGDTVAWSTELLSVAERRAFARLSVFAGGSTLEAAEVVADTSTDTIEALVDSSLLHRVTVNGTARLTMLKTIREHAAALLDDAERARAEAAHIAYFRAFASRLAFVGPAAVAELVTVDADIDNLRAAYDRSAAAGDDETALALAVDLDRYWHIRGHYREACERIRTPLERGAGEPERCAEALRTLSYLTYLRGELGDAVNLANRGAEAATSTGSLDALCGCHTVLGVVALDRHELTTARDHLEQADAIAVALDRDALIARTNGNLADLAMMCGDHEQARQRWEHSLTRPLTPWREVHARWGLATVARRDRRIDEADDHFMQALRLAEAIGYPHYVAIALVGLAHGAADRGQPADAQALLERADAVLEVTGIELVGVDADAYHEARQAASARIRDRQAPACETPRT